ncbi:MAG TPA: di-heme enzyme, partial [Myxococcota bacterium]|nr:di-heme enzyme [Myxococcota bacterium]
DSPLDRYRYGGDPTALSPDAVAGLALFTSERLGCSRCPGDFNFTTSSTHEGSTFEAFAFHNTGLYDVDGEGSYPERDRGLFDITAFYRDMGRFKAPTLRNIAVTAPYMHDGSIATLDAVLDHYAAGGRNLESGPDAGDGRANPFKSELITGFELTHEERGMPRGTPPR